MDGFERGLHGGEEMGENWEGVLISRGIEVAGVAGEGGEIGERFVMGVGWINGAGRSEGLVWVVVTFG